MEHKKGAIKGHVCMHTRLVCKINIEMRVTRTRTKDEDVHNLLRKSIINLVVMIPSSSSSSHIVQICCNNYEFCTCAEIIGTDTSYNIHDF